MNTILLLATALVGAQDIPQDIPKQNLPLLAKCLICDEEELEKPAGGVFYKGVAYYFCNANEIKSFKTKPDDFIPLPLPRPLPKFELADLEGKMWNLEAMKGKVVLIDFWATWCKPCVAMMPAIDRVRAKYKDKGFEVLSVSIDEKKPEFEKFVVKRKFPNPVLYDTATTWSNFAIKAIPATFLVKDGQIVAQWTGQKDEKTFSKAIEAALKG